MPNYRHYLSDVGYRDGERIRREAISDAQQLRVVAAIAAAALNAYDLVENFRKQRNIMRRSLAISEKLHRKAKDFYWPKELEFLEDAFNPEELEAMEVLAKRYAGRLKADIAKLYKEKVNQIKCSMNRYCKSAADKLMQDLMLEKARAFSNAMILGYKMAFDEWQALDDLEKERKLQALGIGRGLVGQAGSFMSVSAGARDKNMNAIAGSFNSALNAIGRGATLASADGVSYHDEAMRMAGGSSTQAILRDGSSAANGNNRRARAGGFDAVSASEGNMTMPSPYGQNGVQQTSVTSNTFISQGDAYMPFEDTLNRQANQSYNATNISAEAEKKNEGIVGNRSLARYGKHLYYDFDYHGKMVKADVDMEHFDLLYSDPDHTRPGSPT